MTDAARMSRLPRFMHHGYAVLRGYYWLPCPVCGRYSGGHEWRRDGLPSSVPDLTEPGLGHGICPRCTREGYGYPVEVSDELWGWTHV